MTPWALALATLLATARATPPTASAEPRREWHGGIGAGGFVAVLGPVTSGLAASAELSPGGAFGRFGARASGRTLDDELADGIDGGLLLGGVVYEAAAARPRLAIALHGEVGAVLPDPHVAVGGGVETTLWIVGPLALALDSTAHLVLRGVDSELLVAGALTIRLAR
jgi:hypothetical protein